ncbi:partial UDP-2-acetamido-2-deoxy-ribo-hexuluronate aminotransferase, partial [Candidatus Brocadiaceae bacterium]
ALLIALMALEIGHGDEVIVPTYSFFATAGVVSRLGATPVFADIDPVTFNLDPVEFEKKITPKTKAVVPVHLYGQSADMDRIMEIAKKHNIKVVEDAAQAISTQYKDGSCVGSIGDIGCFSFFPSKNLGCFGDAGLVTVKNNPELAYKLKILRVHGGEKKYHHSIIGGNFRIDALQAGVLSVKLPHLNKWSEGRRKNADYYIQRFVDAGLATGTGKTSFSETEKILLPAAVYAGNPNIPNHHIYNQFIIRVEKRDELKQFLLDNEVANEIYYPVPFHKQECFANLPSSKESYPHSDFAADHSLAIPIFPDLSHEQLEFAADKIIEFLKKN